MMTFKELKKLVKLPLYKEQRVPTVKALEESGVSVVAEKILENHGSISVYQNGYVIYRAHKRVTVFSLRNCVHYKYDALEGAGHHIEEEEFEEYEWHIRLVLEGEDRIFMNYEIIQGKWMPSREDREYREEILEGVDEAVSTLERMISEERVEELLSTLTDLQRKVVHTHLFHGLSFTEAAKHLGMGYILAYTLNYNNHDGRYSHSNKEWADTTCKGERGSNIRTDWIVRSHPAVLNGFVDMYRKELAVEQQREPEKPFVQQFYVVTDLQTNPMKIEKFGNLDDAMFCYQQVPNFHLKALGVEKTPDPLPGSLDIVQCKNGIDTIVEDYKKVPGWDNPYIQNHVVALVAEALKVQDVAVAYEINNGYFHIQTSEDGYDYTLYNKDFTVMDGGIIEVDGCRPVQEVMEEVLAEHGHSISECGVISAEYLQEQSYRAETQRAEAMKEKLAAETPAPEATISFYVAECAEFPVMGEFHDNLTLEQALEVYDKIPAERMNGIKSIGFSLEDGSIYSGMFDLMIGGEVQAEIVNHIQHYRESPLVQKAISDMKTLLEKRQASKELEERPSTRQSVREALKNRKKAQEQQSNQEQEKPKKAKKKGEMEL